MLRPLFLSLVLAAVPFALLAQDAPRRIELEMTPEEFRAAGLDGLTADQLARLNVWLGRTLDAETAKAAETARAQVKEANRGFLDFGSSEPIVARIAGEFRGFGQGRSYTLDNGHVWEQVDDARLAGVRLQDPGVTIAPALVGNVWYLAVDGYNRRAKVKRIK
ncbi:hypothetical protein [Lysobacter sp. A3-1-A15]|uniref:hypothetical protein n=1 Tax=Novilysobacter viscosus TaxID=3098602 RepID=UPI002ED9543D